jgi:hypothetical protein
LGERRVFRMLGYGQPMIRVRLGLTMLLAVVVPLMTGCDGEGGSSAPTAGPELGLSRAERARDCLRDAGFRVLGGSRPSGDRDAPDAELIVQDDRTGAFIGFYRTAERARRFEDDLRRNAARFDGSVTRHGPVTVVWVRRLSIEERAAVDGCALYPDCPGFALRALPLGADASMAARRVALREENPNSDPEIAGARPGPSHPGTWSYRPFLCGVRVWRRPGSLRRRWVRSRKARKRQRTWRGRRVARSAIMETHPRSETNRPKTPSWALTST